MAKSNRQHFLAGFIAFSAGFLLTLSLIPTGTNPNLLGNFGSGLSFFLYVGFGLCAWVFPFVLFYLAYVRFTDKRVLKVGFKLVGLILAVLSTSVLFREILPNVEMREGAEWGGEMGKLLGDPMAEVLTRFGPVVICFLVVILALWFLEAEDHVVKGLQGAGDGFKRGGGWFKEHGFNAFAVLYEGVQGAIENWTSRQEQKRVVEDAHRKLQGTDQAVKTSAKVEKISKPVPLVPIIEPKPEKAAKPAARKLFTGEAEPEPAPVVAEPVEDEDLVDSAMAEAFHNTDPMTAKQKMQAAGIETGEEDGESVEESKPVRVIRSWKLPDFHILQTVDDVNDKAEVDFEGVSRTLKETLTSFGVDANVVGINPGPTVTQYEVQPASGVKITAIASLADDLALALKCGQVRVVAPIPGKATVGIEVPNTKGRVVTLKELIRQDVFLDSSKKLSVALGKDISGATFVAGLKEMPHVIIAGSTGSGKSVCVNTLIASLIFKYTPEELRLILVDPKRVEMTIYQGLPHLALPVMNDSKEAHLALKWLVREMEERYELLAKMGARDIDSYNAKVAQKRTSGDTDIYPMYYIVVLVDELADLMMVAKDQVEESITRLAQMARAVGIHLVLATQRPSVEVITGIIKANFPSRIAFQVASKVDSRTILDMNGAESLLGRGDMLYLPPGVPKPYRLQGAFVTIEEIERLVEFWKAQGGPQYSADMHATKNNKDVVMEESQDDLYNEAVQIILRSKQASTSFLQRRLKVGYSRAARLLDDMELRGIVGPADGNKPRKIMGQVAGDDFDGGEEALDDFKN
jgi:S-DNA-T family DNA segregation ATPase FtsK/SpoIIIE